MNNSINVQSPNFMAYKKGGDFKQLIKFLNLQTPQAINELNAKMEKAVAALKDTKYADAIVYSENNGGKIYHNVHWRYPVFNDKGEIQSGSGVMAVKDIDEAVKVTLDKESAMTAAFEYAKKQASILKEM